MDTIEHDGFQKGFAGETAERGLMRLGLACAADAETEKNTRKWLKAFDDGEKARKLEEETRPSAEEWSGSSGFHSLPRNVRV